MLIGAHVSAAGGVSNAPANSAAIGGECFQFFSRPPQGGKASELTDSEVAAFKAKMKKYKQKTAYIHAPYFINLASTDNRIYYGSISALRNELERGSRLGVKAMMTHLGSAAGVSSKKKAITMVVAGVERILDGYTGSTQFLIEVSAGAGMVIGDTFEEVAEIIDTVKEAKRFGEAKLPAPAATGSLASRTERLASPSRIGICLDTQHAFASGYDLRTPEAVAETLKRFDKTIGLDRLVCMHVNDSKVEFGSHKDRHEHLGKGHIGLDGFRALLSNSKLKHVDCLVETPDDSKTKDLRKEDVAILKKLRSSSS